MALPRTSAVSIQEVNCIILSSMCATAALVWKPLPPFLSSYFYYWRETKTDLDDFTSSLLQVWCVQLICSHSQIPPVDSGHSTTAHSWSVFILHVHPSPAELMGGMMIRISALGQRCVVLRLFWKDGWRRSDLPLCINRAAVTAGFAIAVAVNVKKNTLKKCYFFLALQV